MPVVTQIQIRRGTATQWTSSNPTLAAGELGLETDTLLMKAGNGSTAWTSLAYINQYALPVLLQNPQTGTTYTLVLTDASNKLVELSNTSAITVTVPLNSSVAFPVGSQIMLLQTNTGQVTVAGASGAVTINGNPGLKLRAQWSSATLIKRATDTWVLVGDITA
jgi:hypothetical protein